MICLFKNYQHHSSRENKLPSRLMKSHWISFSTNIQRYFSFYKKSSLLDEKNRRRYNNKRKLERKNNRMQRAKVFSRQSSPVIIILDRTIVASIVEIAKRVAKFHLAKNGSNNRPLSSHPLWKILAHIDCRWTGHGVGARGNLDSIVQPQRSRSVKVFGKLIPRRLFKLTKTTTLSPYLTSRQPGNIRLN